MSGDHRVMWFLKRLRVSLRITRDMAGSYTSSTTDFDSVRDGAEPSPAAKLNLNIERQEEEMKKYKIILDTVSDVNKFVSIANSFVNAEITVTDNRGLRVNAKSLMGMLYALEFEELWCESESEIYEAIRDYVI